MRIRSNLKPRLIKPLADGSALVEIKGEKGSKPTVVREILGRVRRPKVSGWKCAFGPTFSMPGNIAPQSS